MFPLSLANLGEEAIVRKIGGRAETKRHLDNLGFTVGTDVTVVARLGGMTMKTLKQVKVGETVKVVKFRGEGAIKRRIMDMGLTRRRLPAV